MQRPLTRTASTSVSAPQSGSMWIIIALVAGAIFLLGPLFRGLGKGVDAVGSAAGDVAGLFHSIVRPVKGAVNGVTDFFGGVIDKTGDVVSAVGHGAKCAITLGLAC